MTQRERILAVYEGRRPDVVPFMLDLSHWFYHRTGRPWDLTQSYERPESELIAYHRAHRVGFYVPNLATQYGVAYGEGVLSSVRKESREGRPEIVWRLETRSGSIERRRVWEPGSYSWAISSWGVRDERGLAVLAEALGSRSYEPLWDRFSAWRDEVGENGVVYALTGYSGMGHLLNYWMGVEGALLATADWPAAVRETVETINRNNLRLIDLLAASPAEVVCMGDNFSSDIQPPHFFESWSASYYREAVRRLHAAGKKVAVHVDGRLRGALAMIGSTGADCCDAVTPGHADSAGRGDLSPAACRAEAGPELILSGGVAPELWLPGSPVGRFRQAVLEWLDTRGSSARLIAAAGDQVPPGAEEGRISLMRDLVEEHGRF